jgi:hypothetical protein
MMATIAGVIIAIFLGVIALAVGIFQAWIPVSTPSSASS